MAEGACINADPEIFFPDRGDSADEAKAICNVCPVINECLEYAIDNREKFGVWGGKRTSERKVIIRRRYPNRGQHSLF